MWLQHFICDSAILLLHLGFLKLDSFICVLLISPLVSVYMFAAGCTIRTVFTPVSCHIFLAISTMSASKIAMTFLSLLQKFSNMPKICRSESTKPFSFWSDFAVSFFSWKKDRYASNKVMQSYAEQNRQWVMIAEVKPKQCKHTHTIRSISITVTCIFLMSCSESWSHIKLLPWSVICALHAVTSWFVTWKSIHYQGLYNWMVNF